MGRIKKRNILKIFLFIMIATYLYPLCLRASPEIYNSSRILISKYKDFIFFPLRSFCDKRRFEKRNKLIKDTTITVFEIYQYLTRSNSIIRKP